MPVEIVIILFAIYLFVFNFWCSLLVTAKDATWGLKYIC